MKNMMKMKRYIWLAICSTVLLVAGCSGELNSTILTDKDGCKYMVINKLGVYNLIPVKDISSDGCFENSN